MKNVKILGFITALAFAISSFIIATNLKTNTISEAGYKIGDVVTDFNKAA